MVVVAVGRIMFVSLPAFVNSTKGMYYQQCLSLFENKAKGKQAEKKVRKKQTQRPSPSTGVATYNEIVNQHEVHDHQGGIEHRVHKQFGNESMVLLLLLLLGPLDSQFVTGD